METLTNYLVRYYFQYIVYVKFYPLERNCLAIRNRHRFILKVLRCTKCTFLVVEGIINSEMN